MQRKQAIKFFWVFLDQHLTWKEHTKPTENTENKIAKNRYII